MALHILSRSQASGAPPDSPFRSQSAPPINIVDYAARLVKYALCGERVITVAIVLVLRYCRATNQEVSASNVHRLLLAAVIVGIKAHQDHYYANSYYAKVGGIAHSELNRLEDDLLRGIHFTVFVSKAEAVALEAAFSEALTAMPDHARVADTARTAARRIVRPAVIFSGPPEQHPLDESRRVSVANDLDSCCGGGSTPSMAYRMESANDVTASCA